MGFLIKTGKFLLVLFLSKSMTVWVLSLYKSLEIFDQISGAVVVGMLLLIVGGIIAITVFIISYIFFYWLVNKLSDVIDKAYNWLIFIVITKY
ncbi:MAG: hypothetical protein JKX76_07680 [Colwellia sp.]|nr:hypothetical protein [Colwellia sp.]